MNIKSYRNYLGRDVLILYSDGLHGEVRDDELLDLVQQWENSMENLTQTCLETALEHGGNDNITVIAIQVQAGIEGDE